MGWSGAQPPAPAKSPINTQWEERDLEAAFGEAYSDYKRRTPMLVPRLWARDQGALRLPERSGLRQGGPGR
jgi:hypothetical protein